MFNDEKKNKIKIRKHFSSSGGGINRPTNTMHNMHSPSPNSPLSERIEEIQKEIKNLKKTVGRLNNIAQQEEQISKEYANKPIHIVTNDLKEHLGLLNDISRYQISIIINEKLTYFYKSAIIYYYF